MCSSCKESTEISRQFGLFKIENKHRRSTNPLFSHKAGRDKANHENSHVRRGIVSNLQGVYVLVEVSIYISTTWRVSLLVVQVVLEGTCRQVLGSTSIDF